MVRPDHADHSVLEQFFDLELSGRLEDGRKPQHHIQIAAFQRLRREGGFRALDVDIHPRRRAADALDQRRDEQEFHVVGRGDHETPLAAAGIEALGRLDDPLHLAEDRPHRLDQGQGPFGGPHAGIGPHQDRVIQLLP